MTATGKQVGSRSRQHPDGRRWVIALAGTWLQVCLGTVYAWSYFQLPIVQEFHCGQSAAAWAFSLAIGMLGIAAAWGGLKLPVYGPTRLAVAGGALYGGGFFIASLALRWHSLPLFYLGYGIVGGFGLGLGYVTPVATVARWFPDKKGLMTGLVVMGFGLGALLMSKAIAPLLMRLFENRLELVFAALGILCLLAAVPSGLLLRNPPSELGRGTESEVNDKKSPAAGPILGLSSSVVPSRVLDEITADYLEQQLGSAHPDTGHPSNYRGFLSRRFLMMWLLFFCNITAGIMLIGFQSPLLQELLRARHPQLTPAQLAASGATLIGLSSLCNGLGRLVWGGLSDRWGRTTAFRLILGTQIPVFLILTQQPAPWLFCVLVGYVLLCYGGGFGTMPSFATEVFGMRDMPVYYGALLTAWSMAGVAGPQLLALIKDRFPTQAFVYAFSAASVLTMAGFIIAARFPARPAIKRISE